MTQAIQTCKSEVFGFGGMRRVCQITFLSAAIVVVYIFTVCAPESIPRIHAPTLISYNEAVDLRTIVGLNHLHQNARERFLAWRFSGAAVTQSNQFRRVPTARYHRLG